MYACVCLTAASSILHAQEQSDSELFRKLNAIESVQADFVQDAVSEDGIQEATQEGYIAFQRPGNFLWVVKKPFEQHVLIDGTKMSIYDPDLEQLTHSEMDSSNQLSLANLLISPDAEILDNFDVTQENGEFSLVPEDVVAPFKQLVIVFDGEKIKSVRVIDHANTVSSFKFTNIRFNEEIKSEVFEITVPPETEVVTHGEINESPAD